MAKKNPSVAILRIMRGQHSPRELRTLNGVPVKDQENDPFDNVMEFRGGTLLAGTYTFSFWNDLRREQRKAQQAGHRTRAGNAGTASCPIPQLIIFHKKSQKPWSGKKRSKRTTKS